jgi:hypothetical protein
MKITASKLKMIIAEEVAKAELQKRIIERRRARLSESRNKSSNRVVEATPSMINRIIREELEVYQQEKRLAEARRRRRSL